MKKFLCVLLVLLCVSMFNGCDYILIQPPQTETVTGTESDVAETTAPPVGNENNPYVMDADTLYAELCSGASLQKYNDQWVKISGTVLCFADMGDQIGYRLAGGSNSSVLCLVNVGGLPAQHGQIIECVGKISTDDKMHIVITTEELLSITWPTAKPQSPITISEWTWAQDYVGGIEWNFKLTNNTDKTVKYVTLEWYCYNAVGDLVYDAINGKPYCTMKFTGPLEAGQTSNLLRNTSLFYNYSYNSSKLSRLEVEFMDGTVIWVSTQGYDDVIED